MTKYKTLQEILSEEGDMVDTGAKQRDLSRVKVRLFFDRLNQNQALMRYLDFRSPAEQAEAIVKFASIIGVPAAQIPAIVTSLRQVSAAAKKQSYGK